MKCIVLDVLQTNKMITEQVIMWCHRLGSQSIANDDNNFSNTGRHNIPQQVLPKLPICHFRGVLSYNPAALAVMFPSFRNTCSDFYIGSQLILVVHSLF